MGATGNSTGSAFSVPRWPSQCTSANAPAERQRDDRGDERGLQPGARDFSRFIR
jgi:hypothetical protein